MKINRVLIRNFRSIKVLEFCPGDICALVGENNVGKTNILAALNFLLGETWPSKRGLEASDYYNQDTTRPIHIEVGLSENPRYISRIWCTIPWEGQAETKVEYREGSGYLSNEIRDQCALVYLDANRNLEYHLGHSRWTLFGRIIRQLDADFRDNAPEGQQQELVLHFNKARDVLQTELYRTFEATFKTAFSGQLKRTTYNIEMEFCTFDPLNYYRSIQPLLLEEDGTPKNPSSSGQGMRNLILLALFRTYAKVFKGDAVVAIEEPEIYLHPHAQRSLAALFDELAKQGSQIFYSTHSGNFIDIEHFDRIGLVEKCIDANGDLCTQVRQVSARQLLQRRQRLYPGVPMSECGLRERYRNICGLEHNEAFFARRIVLVEGETEEYALPIFAQALGYDFDAYGVSVVNAHGKNNLDQLYQLYTAFGIPVYLVFDNDRGGKEEDLAVNETLLRMLDLSAVSREPDRVVDNTFAILERNFENEMKVYLETVISGKYDQLSREAIQTLGAKAGKGLVARFMAQRLTAENIIPQFISEIIKAVQSLGKKADSDGNLRDTQPVDNEIWFR